jgi:predicted metal-dependent hydrolase
MIQVAAAFHHYRRGNWHGTVLLLQAALRRLEPCPDGFGGIGVGELRADIRLMAM